MTSVGVIEEMSRRGSEQLSVEWKIPNFPSLLDGRHPWYLSPVFRLADECWRLSIMPNWKSEVQKPASGQVRLDLDRIDAGPPKTFNFSVGIKGSGGVLHSSIRAGEREFSNLGYYFWDDFCSRSELLENRTRVMPNGTLTISCVLKRPEAAGALSDGDESEVYDIEDSDESEEDYDEDIEEDDDEDGNNKASKSENSK